MNNERFVLIGNCPYCGLHTALLLVGGEVEMQCLGECGQEFQEYDLESNPFTTRTQLRRPLEDSWRRSNTWTNGQRVNPLSDISVRHW